MNIGLIGSGGREHALCKKISESKLVKTIICFPGKQIILSTNLELYIFLQRACSLPPLPINPIFMIKYILYNL